MQVKAKIARPFCKRTLAIFLIHCYKKFYSIKKGVLKNFGKFIGKHLFFKNTFFYRTLPVAASGVFQLLWLIFEFFRISWFILQNIFNYIYISNNFSWEKCIQNMLIRLEIITVIIFFNRHSVTIIICKVNFIFYLKNYKRLQK